MNNLFCVLHHPYLSRALDWLLALHLALSIQVAVGGGEAVARFQSARCPGVPQTLLKNRHCPAGTHTASGWYNVQLYIIARL